MPNAAWLAIAILAEVIATSCLKASAAFTRPLPSVAVVIGYGVSFYCLSLALRTVPVGIAYAIWSGVGIVLVTTIAWIAYGQKLDGLSLAGMALIVAGVVVLDLRQHVAG